MTNDKKFSRPVLSVNALRLAPVGVLVRVEAAILVNTMQAWYGLLGWFWDLSRCNLTAFRRTEKLEIDR